MIAVVSAIPSRGLFVIADRAQLSQVMANLVANARDAMPGGGMVSVAAHGLAPDATFPFGVVPHPDDFVEISVRDTGGGMPPKVMDRIFEPLYTTRESGGTGLGLAVAHQILTQHGGYIFVESEPGRGSTFHLLLPKTTPPSSDIAAATGHGRILVARKLLMIEDEQAIVEGITALLELDGIEVQAIGNGNETAEALARFHPDTVLLDYGLPGMDGSQVYAQIRALDPLLPVIFASGHGDRRLEDGIEDPLTRFLQKPFNVADLLEMIVDLEVGGSA
jgi:two-component system, cell cycle sensor histidine kinase and response regulator CckA